MPTSRIHDGTDRPSRIASWAPIAISSRSPAGYAVLNSRSARPPLPSSTAGPMKNTHSSTAAATATIRPSTSAPTLRDRPLEAPQHRQSDRDQHVPADVEHVAEVRIDVEVEHVLVHAPRHVAGDEQELAEHDQHPRGATFRQVPGEPQRDSHDPAEADVPVDVRLHRVCDEEERDHQQHADDADRHGARLLP